MGCIIDRKRDRGNEGVLKPLPQHEKQINYISIRPSQGRLHSQSASRMPLQDLYSKASDAQKHLKNNKGSQFSRQNKQITKIISRIVDDMASTKQRHKLRVLWRKQILQISCNEDRIPLYLQVHYGFPLENVVLQQYSQSKKIIGSSNIRRKQKFYALSLKQSILIFIKLSIQCQVCFQCTTATFSVARFQLLLSNCECNSENVKVSFLKKFPSTLRIWSDQGMDFVKTQRQLKRSQQDIYVFLRKQSLRLIGCNSCLRFSELYSSKVITTQLCRLCQSKY